MLYKTSQIELAPGQQLRITAGTRTIFVWVNGRGLHFSKGGYVKRKRRAPTNPPHNPEDVI